MAGKGKVLKFKRPGEQDVLPAGWPNKYGPAMPDWMKERAEARRQAAKLDPLPFDEETTGDPGADR